eukprot:10946668-Prorocentrum_lima.AAC.1
MTSSERSWHLDGLTTINLIQALSVLVNNMAMRTLASPHLQPASQRQPKHSECKDMKHIQ